MLKGRQEAEPSKSRDSLAVRVGKPWPEGISIQSEKMHIIQLVWIAVALILGTFTLRAAIFGDEELTQCLVSIAKEGMFFILGWACRSPPTKL